MIQYIRRDVTDTKRLPMLPLQKISQEETHWSRLQFLAISPVLGRFCHGLSKNAQEVPVTFPNINSYNFQPSPIHRQFRAALPLSKRFMGVLSGGEIHCLRRLRDEGYPEIPRNSPEIALPDCAGYSSKGAWQKTEA